LHRYGIFIHLGEIAGLYAKLAGIFGVIAVPLFLVRDHLPGGNVLHLLIVLGVSGLGYLGVAKLFKIVEVGAAFGLFLKRNR
jgi:hypothetical protein